jgi:hypothetical protein
MKVDPHAGEPTADLDPATYSAYMEAKANAKSWKAEAERLENMLNEQLGDAYAGLVDGRKLVYHRPEKRFQAAQLQKDYPELTQHFLRLEYVNVFDVEAFAKLHPEIAEQYRTRSFRSLADV